MQHIHTDAQNTSLKHRLTPLNMGHCSNTDDITKTRNISLKHGLHQWNTHLPSSSKTKNTFPKYEKFSTPENMSLTHKTYHWNRNTLLQHITCHWDRKKLLKQLSKKHIATKQNTSLNHTKHPWNMEHIAIAQNTSLKHEKHPWNTEHTWAIETSLKHGTQCHNTEHMTET